MNVLPSGRARVCYAAGRRFDPGSSLEAIVGDQELDRIYKSQAR